MGFDNTTADRQAEPGPALSSGVLSAIKLLKNALFIPGRDAWTPVSDFDDDTAVGSPG
jgi:hypothetical protein